MSALNKIMNFHQALEKAIPPSVEEDEEVVGIVGFSGITTMFDTPRSKLGLTCPDCGQLVDYTSVLKDAVSGKMNKLGICSSHECLEYTRNKKPWCPGHSHKDGSAWVDFRQANRLGDNEFIQNIRYEDLKFGSDEKRLVDRFMKNPRGVWVLCGNTGTGKTCDALAICESFIRKQPSCLFVTEYVLSREWLQSRDEKRELHFIKSLEDKILLVIDDLGQGGLTDGFTRMLRELIDQRNLWKDKATIFTTNYSFNDLIGVLDASFVDRIQTGQFITYDEKSRRR